MSFPLVPRQKQDFSIRGPSKVNAAKLPKSLDQLVYLAKSLTMTYQEVIDHIKASQLTHHKLPNFVELSRIDGVRLDVTNDLTTCAELCKVRDKLLAGKPRHDFVMANWSRELKEATARVGKAKQEFAELSKTYSNDTAEFNQLAASIEEERNSMQYEEAVIQQAVDDAEKEDQELEAEIEDLKKRLEVASVQTRLFHDQAELTNAETLSLEQKAQRMESTKSTISAELESAKAKVASSEAVLTGLKNDVDSLKAEGEKLEIQNAKVVDGFEQQVQQLLEELVSKDKEINLLETNVATLNESLLAAASQPALEPQSPLSQRSAGHVTKSYDATQDPLAPVQRPSRRVKLTTDASENTPVSTPGKKQAQLPTKRWNTSPKVDRPVNNSSVPGCSKLKPSLPTKPSLVKAAGKAPVKAAEPAAEVRGASSLPTNVVSGGPMVVTAKAPSSHGMVLRKRTVKTETAAAPKPKPLVGKTVGGSGKVEMSVGVKGKGKIKSN
ncbi:hypothetical protein HDU76_004646, partial [Blyttiomyces sp. JEL0837]